MKHISIRVLQVMISWFDLQLEQLDMKMAFLHGELEKKIFMHQSEGFVIEGKDGHACMLKKSFYGLKQSSKTMAFKV